MRAVADEHFFASQHVIATCVRNLDAFSRIYLERMV